MRLLIIRHGDPDYENDRLTQTGKKEAQLLVERMKREKIDAFYVSPLRRARQTAAPTLAALDREATELDWLREFPARLDINGNAFLQEAFPDTLREEDQTFKRRIMWDQLPASWRDDPAYYDQNAWRTTLPVQHSDMEEVYARVCEGLDRLLAEHGYVRKGNLYVTEQGNNKTLALFCHFGLTCAILSHLWSISPMLLWHCISTAPTSVTEVYTEERVKGIATFRAARIGDISHLYVAGARPSFSARFCEAYENDERH